MRRVDARSADAPGPRPDRTDGPEPPVGPSRPDGPLRRSAAVVGCALALLATAGCDNIVKYVDTFATMTDGPAVETYEQKPRPAPEGVVPVEGRELHLPLQVADTSSLLQNPLSGTEAQLARGDTLYGRFCLPCHGTEGRGRGPVMNWDGQENEANNNRMPFLPAANLVAGTGPERSDGYIWGMIENGRGLMPAYERIPREDRWYIVEYVRHLQRQAGADPVRGAAGPADEAEAR